MKRIVSALLLGGLLLVGTAAIDPAQFECEEAVAHLQDCCPTLGQELHCGEGCEGTDYSQATAACIRKASCDSLRKQGVCETPRDVECE